MMEKEEKRMETKTTRQPYRKPQLEQVQLVAEEAVLTNCKTAAAGGPTSPTYSVIISTCVTIECELAGS